MTSPNIRRATLDDAAALASLVTVLGYPTTEPEMRTRLSAVLMRTDYATFVADANGTVVGLAGAMAGLFYEKNGCYARLVVLVVDTEHRGSNVGEALVREVERWSAAQGASEILVTSRTERVAAHRFYERLGYRPTGVRFVKPLS